MYFDAPDTWAAGTEYWGSVAVAEDWLEVNCCIVCPLISPDITLGTNRMTDNDSEAILSEKLTDDWLKTISVTKFHIPQI